jgi:hypothetical protein
VTYSEEDWWALVGPTPRPLAAFLDQTPHDKTRRLGGEEVLGATRLRPGGRLLVEHERAEPADLEGVLDHESWPIIVEGTVPQAVELEHDIETARLVVRVATLLSVAWREPWTVRTSPKRSINLPPSVPESWPPPPESFPDEPLALQLIVRDPDSTMPQSLPGWLGGAWAELDNDPMLWHASLTWHEGLLLQGSHPSFAAVAYVSSVDALADSQWAASNFTLPKNAGSRTRVRTLLESVINGHDVDRLIRVIYDARNDIAHDGRLLAFEASLGAVSAMTLKFHMINETLTPVLHAREGDEVHEFLAGVLRPLALASHGLMLRALGGATPIPE